MNAKPQRHGDTEKIYRESKLTKRAIKEATGVLRKNAH